MIRITIGFGVALMVLGVAAYMLSGRSSFTALIPAVFGGVMVGCGFAGRMKKQLQKGSIGVALSIAALGGFAALWRVLPGVDFATPLSLSQLVQLLMGGGLMVYVGTWVVLWVRRA